MELRHLRYFVTLAEELHFARAAEKLNIAPPTLTVQIQEIERTLATRLFVRTKRSVALTTAGDVFLAEARNVLAQFAKAESAGRRAGRGEIGRIEIGYVGSAAYGGVLQELTNRFRQIAPEVEINAREFPMDDLPGLIVDGRVDVGFLRLPMVLPKSLRCHILLRDCFSLALSSFHAEAGSGEPVEPERLAVERFIAPEQQSGTYEVARRGNFTPRIVSTPGGLLAVLTQVSLGVGISIVPSVVEDVIRMPGVVFRPLAGEAIISEIATVHRANESSPAVRQLIALMRKD
ncbi:LysR family transcriptional regulator [Rhizobium sp. P38BS-XIX]|uniref:LysR substrate-binding domain-containing protein n=1 Tax=Rhizobium sp. P38BS-XIX TaxID=2726740 RepID=UPI0014578059|nr:LysR substrate-binding domain-containing protein [Rhizobium sp. P38BS-XIX]NLS00426.1 LysR family transcriptional regulator [Rhizobium sp. P38BS-XIX]